MQQWEDCSSNWPCSLNKATDTAKRTSVHGCIYSLLVCLDCYFCTFEKKDPWVVNITLDKDCRVSRYLNVSPLLLDVKELMLISGLFKHSYMYQLRARVAGYWADTSQSR